MQENSYYAYGMSMTSTMALPTAPNKKLYNGGSEWQNDYQDQPDWQQTFYRNYDQTIGRFLAVDPMAEATSDMSVYQYGNNNPVMFNDPLGDLSKAELTEILTTLGNNKFGGEWHSNQPNSVTMYGDDLMGFYMGARFMSEHNMFGLNDGWAQNYNVGAANFNTFTSGAKAAYSNGGNVVVGMYYHDVNGNATTINGVSGEFQSIATQALKTRTDYPDPWPARTESVLSEIWNSSLVRAAIPDVIGIHISATLVPTVGAGYSFNFDLITRGRDAGLHVSQSLSGRVGEEAGVGLNLIKGWYYGDARNATFDSLTGWGGDINFAAGPVNAGAWASFDTKNNRASWLGTSGVQDGVLEAQPE